MTTKEKHRFRQQAEQTAEEQRRIQREVERYQSDHGKPRSKDGGNAPQTHPQQQPGTPLPEQHLEKPGMESQLNPKPRFRAEAYTGSGKLQGMVALVTGGDSGIGRAVCVLFAREGADVAVLYLSEHEDAEETWSAVEAEGRRCMVLPATSGTRSSAPKPYTRSSRSSAVWACWSTTRAFRNMCPRSSC